VPSLLAPEDIRQMQILDSTVMLCALDLTDHGLIQLYALVQAGLTPVAGSNLLAEKVS